MLVDWMRATGGGRRSNLLGRLTDEPRDSAGGRYDENWQQVYHKQNGEQYPGLPQLACGNGWA